MSLWNSSSFLTLQNREKADSKVPGSLSEKTSFLACLQNTCKNAIVSPRDIADRAVTIHIPCDSIQFRLLPFNFDYVTVS